MIGRGPALLEAEIQRPTLKESGEFWQEERGWCWWFRRSVRNRVDQQQYTRVEGCLFVLEIRGSVLRFSCLSICCRSGCG